MNVMTWHNDGSARTLQLIAAYLVAVLIFTIDAVVQKELLAVLYVIPVALTGFWTRSRESSRVIFITGFCTFLLLAGLVALPTGHGPLLTDRLLVLAAIWMTAILSLLRKKQEELDLLRGMLPLCASCKKIRDNTGYWEELESYLQNQLRVGYSHSFCPECAGELLSLAKKGTQQATSDEP
jgi:uncharacterized membrane protein